MKPEEIDALAVGLKEKPGLLMPRAWKAASCGQTTIATRVYQRSRVGVGWWVTRHLHASPRLRKRVFLYLRYDNS